MSEGLAEGAGSLLVRWRGITDGGRVGAREVRAREVRASALHRRRAPMSRPMVPATNRTARRITSARPCQTRSPWLPSTNPSNSRNATPILTITAVTSTTVAANAASPTARIPSLPSTPGPVRLAGTASDRMIAAAPVVVLIPSGTSRAMTHRPDLRRASPVALRRNAGTDAVSRDLHEIPTPYSTTFTRSLRPSCSEGGGAHHGLTRAPAADDRISGPPLGSCQSGADGHAWPVPWPEPMGTTGRS
jgi:hypothetical protein